MIALSVFLLLNGCVVSFAWNISITLTPTVRIGDNFELKCIVHGNAEEIQSSKLMKLFCPFGIMCYENCDYIPTTYDRIHSSELGKFQCEHLNIESRSILYSYKLPIVEKSWIAFNNSLFACEYNNRRVYANLTVYDRIDYLIGQISGGISLQLTTSSGKDDTLWMIIMIVFGSLLLISLSFNVGFCSWYVQLRKRGKRAKKQRKAEKEMLIRQQMDKDTVKGKSKSLDLTPKKEFGHDIIRSKSVVLVPYIPYCQSPNGMLARMSYGVPSTSSNTVYQDTNTNRLNRNYEKQIVYRIDEQSHETIAGNRSEPEQVASFKHAIDKKMNIEIEYSSDTESKV